MLPESAPSEPEAYAAEVGWLLPSLLPDERIIRVATISSGIYWKGITMMVLALFTLVFAFRLAVYFLIIGFVMLLIGFATKYSLYLAATNRRIIVRSGVFNQDTVELSYPKIESVELAWSPMGRILGYATIFITGTGRTRFGVPFIDNPLSWRDDLMQQLMEKENMQTYPASGAGV
jgi:uncharacterized membrane protein YdbT with pleckstrin-like domain